jgi:phenylacetate-CoA ligase
VPSRQAKDRHIYWRHNYPGNALLFSTTHLSPDNVTHYARKLLQFEPELLEGYPSAMLIVARLARGLRLELPRPSAIIVSAETLFPEDRVELEETFGCRVYDQYAASEPSCFWCDCEQGVMHINPEYGISEIVAADGEPAPLGDAGDVVVTSFLNPAMPLIRYRLGDIAIAGTEIDCACGRHMARIERVVGRIDDILFVPSRGYVGRLDPAFKGLESIVEAQIVQESLTKIRVLIVPDNGFDTSVGNRLLSNLRTKLGSEVEMSVEQVQSIPRAPNRKFQSVISKVKHHYPDRS